MNRTGIVTVERIDPRTPQIVEKIRELDRHMGRLYPAESNHLADIDTLAGPDSRVFAAKVDGNCLGCGAILVCDGYAEVKRIFVSPQARGLGLARRVIDRLEAETAALGLPLMRIETGISQPEALKLFTTSGFCECPAFGGYSQEDLYSIFLEKSVRSAQDGGSKWQPT